MRTETALASAYANISRVSGEATCRPRESQKQRVRKPPSQPVFCKFERHGSFLSTLKPGGRIIAFKKALRALLETLLNYNYSRAEDLAKRWFNDPAARTEVVEILGKFKLDESAIEAEAIRISSASLEGIDRMLAAAELRRSRAFRNIEDCRASFAKTIRTVSDRALQQSGEPLSLQLQE